MGTSFALDVPRQHLVLRYMYKHLHFCCRWEIHHCSGQGLFAYSFVLQKASPLISSTPRRVKHPVFGDKLMVPLKMFREKGGNRLVRRANATTNLMLLLSVLAVTSISNCLLP